MSEDVDEDVGAVDEPDESSSGVAPTGGSQVWREAGEWYAAYLAGLSYRAIARQFGADARTVARRVRKFAEAEAGLREEGAPQLQTYIDRLQRELAHARDLHAKCSREVPAQNGGTRVSDPSNALGAAKLVASLSEKLAAAQGVITRREGVEMTGKDGEPVAVEFGSKSIADLARIILAEHEARGEETPA